MDFWKNAADSVTKAVDFIVDKNRKTAMMNRLKIVIRNEKEKQAAAYIQLGKYYYHSLRDSENGDTEPFCCTVDRTGERLKRAYAKLDELAVPTEAEPKSGCCCCGDTECSGEEYDDDEYSDEPDETAAEEQENDIPGEAFRQEAADDDEDYLHPFTVVPNDGAVKEENPDETGEGAAEPEEKAAEDKKPEENTAGNNEVPNPTTEPTNF